eukprot:TRINITY_DN72003_c0_g1_i1.p1 TRINITY_DN72003_c0_g1~~TRINITY_DN72003_c0_g1_i1.p1  ORF type:complete len:194 (-),score=46.50 TRINITY_DN72003_c0_g1_i1:127-708(-)
MASTAFVLAAVLGVLAVGVLVLYLLLWWAETQRKKAIRERKRKKADEKAATAAAAAARGGSEAPGGARRDAAASRAGVDRADQAAGLRKVERDPECLRLEQELKRDALHIFRRLSASSDTAERNALCGEAVTLYDSIERRLGSSMPRITSGRIVYCNALMECGGLDELRTCQDANDSNATELVSRVVPVIFAS